MRSARLCIHCRLEGLEIGLLHIGEFQARDVGLTPFRLVKIEPEAGHPSPHSFALPRPKGWLGAITIVPRGREAGQAALRGPRNLRQVTDNRHALPGNRAAQLGRASAVAVQNQAK